MKEITAKKAFSMTGLALLAGTAAIILSNLAMAPFVTEEKMIQLKERFGPSLLLLLTYVPEIVFMLVFWVVIRNLPVRRWETKKLGFKTIAGIFVMMYFVSSVLNMIGTGISSLPGTGGGHGSMELMDKMVTTRLLGAILIPVIIAPVCEEIVFRKLMLDRLRCYGEKTAILFTAVCFGLFHGNLTQLFFTVGVGFFLGYVYCKTGKIHITIIMHILVNSLSTGIILLLPLLENENAEGMVAILAAALVLAVLMISGLICLIRTIRRRTLTFDDTMPESIPRSDVVKTVWLNPTVLLFAALNVFQIILDLFQITLWN